MAYLLKCVTSSDREYTVAFDDRNELEAYASRLKLEPFGIYGDGDDTVFQYFAPDFSCWSRDERERYADSIDGLL